MYDFFVLNLVAFLDGPVLPVLKSFINSFIIICLWFAGAHKINFIVPQGEICAGEADLYIKLT